MTRTRRQRRTQNVIEGSTTSFQVFGCRITYESPNGYVYRLKLDEGNKIFSASPDDLNRYAKGQIAVTSAHNGTDESRAFGKELSLIPGVHEISFLGNQTVIVRLHRGSNASTVLTHVYRKLVTH